MLNPQCPQWVLPRGPSRLSLSLYLSAFRLPVYIQDKHKTLSIRLGDTSSGPILWEPYPKEKNLSPCG